MTLSDDEAAKQAALREFMQSEGVPLQRLVEEGLESLAKQGRLLGNGTASSLCHGYTEQQMETVHDIIHSVGKLTPACTVNVTGCLCLGVASATTWQPDHEQQC